MPEPEQKAVQGEQDANNATTPQQPAADQPTTPQQSEPKHGYQGVMDLLDIPAEVQDQIAPPVEEPKKKTEEPEKRPAQPEPEPEPEDEESEVEEAETEEDEQERPAAQEEPQKFDKRQKRINRLTRKTHQLESQLDSALDRIKELEGEGGKRAKQKSDEPFVPSASPWLAHVKSESQLNTELAKARSVIEWCDANPDGAGLTDESIDEAYKKAYNDGNLTQEEALSKSIAKWRRESEKAILDAPQRREEIRGYNGARGHFDGMARQIWPELFDKSSEDYQVAQQLLGQFPSIKGSPQANYAIGLVIEGARSLQARMAQVEGKNGGKAHRDISERAFEPRVPLAPHTAEPPSREATPSSQKVLNEAMSNLVSDVDGGSASLAAAFGAMDQVQKTRASGRTRVSR
jgi:hypothetical protein